jgi:hypothetical protein
MKRKPPFYLYAIALIVILMVWSITHPTKLMP